MSEPRVIPAGGGEVIGDAPHRRVEILADEDPLHATWSRFGPRSEGADLHVHRHHTDLFYVLDGELTARLGPEDEAVAANAGTLVRVPPLVVHGFANDSAADVRYLNFHAPGVGFADYLRALRDGRTLVYDQEPPPADGGRPTGEATIGEPVDTETIAIAVSTLAPGEAVPDATTEGGVHGAYVLDGELTVDAERARAGAWVRRAAGARNAGGQHARCLVVRAPGRG
jgi:quercetin dioxygenase-like cupin family protein